MKKRFYLGLALFGCCSCLLKAASVTNWHTFRATRATSLSNQGTSSPVFGSPAATSSSAFLIGYFDAISLTNLGDRLTLSFRVSFTDPGGMSNHDDQFRFALCDINGQPRIEDGDLSKAGVAGYTDKWGVYWFGLDASQSGALGSIRKRVEPNLHPLANAGATLIEVPTGDPVDPVSSTDPAGGPLYFGEMAIERTSSGLALAGYFGGNGMTNLYAAQDPGPFPASYSAVGFLNGASSSCDQINFHDVTVNYAVSNALGVAMDPSSTTVTVGDQAIFHVSSKGTGLIPSIQWLENGTNIVGATNRALIVPVTQVSQNNNVYNAIISNDFGDRVTSGAAVLTVTK